MGPISGRFTEKWPKSNRFFRGGLWPRRDDCYFARGGKVTKTPPGGSFDEHMACASVHRRRPPGPPIYGGVSLWPLCNPRRAKSRPVSVLFSAHRGLLPSKFEGIYILTHTAWCVPTCWVRWRSGGPAATALPRQAVSVQRRHFLISAPVGPCGPRQGGCKVLCSEPPDEISYFPGGRPLVKRGSGGKPPMSARCAKALIEGGPQSLFGSFLVIQKGTRPAGRNPLKTHQKETHNAERR